MRPTTAFNDVLDVRSTYLELCADRLIRRSVGTHLPNVDDINFGKSGTPVLVSYFTCPQPFRVVAVFLSCRPSEIVGHVIQAIIVPMCRFVILRRAQSMKSRANQDVNGHGVNKTQANVEVAADLRRLQDRCLGCGPFHPVFTNKSPRYRADTPQTRGFVSRMLRHLAPFFAYLIARHILASPPQAQAEG